MFRIFAILAVTLGTLALAKISKAQIADLKGQEPLTTLEGSEWGPENGMDQFVLFMSGGDLAGFAGCNNFFGTYEQDGETLTLGPLITTKKMCDGVMGSEGAFLAALQSARSFEASHLEINLINEAGRVALSMRRRDWD